MMSSVLTQVVAGVLVRDGHVLICQRSAAGHHPGRWEFPGGKVEAGEGLEEALRRELREELAIEISVGSPLWQTQYHYPGRNPFVLTFFPVPNYIGNVANRVFAAVQWAALGSLASFDFLEADREFVAQLASGRIELTASRQEKL
ncbi:MAG: (deoxy)nucleoside triphosphate pyrophosphohydrolase [Candidatus Binatia bacterium]